MDRPSAFARQRRRLLRSLGAAFAGAIPLGAVAAEAQGGRTPDAPRFAGERVIDTARALAGRPFVDPPPVPAVLATLDYDAYRRIRYRKERAVWGRAPTRFSAEFFAPGFLFEYGVDVRIVESGQVRTVDAGADAFDVPDPAIGEALAAFGQFAGFRLHYPLNRSDYRDEFVVFQGASYFRAVSRGQRYGLSARGLAIDVAEPEGEEFPIFRRFWIERPSADANAIVVHALLDSRRCAGAYRFAIYPGAPTTLDVDAVLFARENLTHIGLGPLTSMFMHGPMDAPVRADYRPRVHDSLGLAMETGRGERLWRPLQNPRSLQISAFVDRSPAGFGVIQRERRFESFQDLEARYELRPSAWVAPRGDWGAGHVQLVEIPSDEETNDNIVAYWRPATPLLAGSAFEFAYRLTWPDQAPRAPGIAPISRCAQGFAFGTALPQVVFDLATEGVEADAVAIDASISRGRVVEAIVQRNSERGGLRVIVNFDPGDAAFAELRVVCRAGERPIAETLLHRWLR
ncbi:MAG: glucan biosynthesis protein G [Pseudomonadales bacterium]|jgi:glucan biosynthesis protein|nr:glucan biosynthesis protein G [Pseudomonadales bacterium]